MSCQSRFFCINTSTTGNVLYHKNNELCDDCALPVQISKEDINSLPIGRWEGPSRLVRTVEEVRGAVRSLSQASLLGFDTETRPAFRKGQKFPPSLLQLATGDEVFLFQLKNIGLPESLITILSDPAIVKVGVALDFDVISLQALQPFQPKGFIDLARLARRRGIKNQGLRGLAAVVCGIRISKSARTTNWASDDLTLQQIQYAATDAWIGREIYCRLESLSVEPKP
jgi:ribonuclease D